MNEWMNVGNGATTTATTTTTLASVRRERKENGNPIDKGIEK
jgi:hypothetical protein